VGRNRTSPGQSSLAVDLICDHRWAIDIEFAEKPRAGQLLALAGSVSKVPDSFFVADRRWGTTGIATRFRGNEF
jgi:hypothetical protein